MNKIKPRIFYFSFTDYPRWVCRVVLHYLTTEQYDAITKAQYYAWGQGSTPQEAYDNWLISMEEKEYEYLHEYSS